MTHVNIDGDVLTLNVPRPETVEALAPIVGKLLFEKGRVIRLIFVDGEEATANPELLKKRGYVKVEFHSVSIAEDMINEIDQLMENKDAIIAFMYDFSSDVLTTEWVFNSHNSNRLSLVIVTMVILLNKACTLMKDTNKELVDELKTLLDSFTSSRNLYTSAGSFRDAICISDIIANRLIPTTQRALELIQGPIRDHFVSMNAPSGCLVF